MVGRDRTWLALGVTLTAIGWTGCGVGAESAARPVAADRLPPALQPAATTVVRPPLEGGPAVELWFVRREQLVPVVQQVPTTSPAEVLDGLIQRPGEGPSGAGLRSALIDAELVAGVERADETASVDLAASFSSLPSGEQLLAAGQVVCTLTGLPGIERVSFAVEGVRVDVPVADGSQATGPLTCGDYRSIVAS